MMTEQNHMQWYAKATSAGQAVIADEVTGKTIAVAYDAKHGALLAAAPVLLNALELAEATILRLVPDVHARGSVQGTLDVLRWAKQSAQEA